MNRLCPVCARRSLGARVFHGVHIDVCPSCAGVWFDECEARELLGQAPTALETIDHAVIPNPEDLSTSLPERSCPVCLIPLDRMCYAYSSPIELDHCHGCGGFWVDDGELIQMRRYVDEHRDGPVARGQRQSPLGRSTSGRPLEHLEAAWTMVASLLRRSSPGR